MAGTFLLKRYWYFFLSLACLLGVLGWSGWSHLTEKSGSLPDNPGPTEKRHVEQTRSTPDRTQVAEAEPRQIQPTERPAVERAETVSAPTEMAAANADQSGLTAPRETDQTGSLARQLEAVRAKAREALDTRDLAARHLKLTEAADLGMATLEAFDDSEWNPQELQGFLMDMAYAWLSKLPREDQEAWVASHASTVRSPSGHLVVGFFEWKVGKRATALARAAHILSAAPDSFAAGAAMMGVMTVHYHQGDLESAAAALKSFIETAPNNRATASALCGYTWAVCRKGKPQHASGLITDILASKPHTRVGEMAGKLREVLNAIERRDYPAAFSVLETFEIDYWKETVLNDLVLTFVVPARSPDARRLLINAMTAIAADHPHPAARPFAKCIIGTTYRVHGQPDRAAQVLEEVLHETQSAPDPLIRMAFEGYLFSQLGVALAKHDPARAIDYLERFRRGYGGNAGAEFYAIKLGRAYLDTGQPDKALEVFSRLEDRRKAGRTVAAKKLKGGIQSGLIASLDRLGRHAEAQALAEPLLAQHGYAKPISSLSPPNRHKLAVLLGMMDREEEARRYR